MALTEDSDNSRFQSHVSFDNFAGGEPTEKNTISFTLNVKHKGYQFKRRSRTFMVGIDENEYSDIALSWLLEELVDDGDEVICLRVVDKDNKNVQDRNVERRDYQKDAKKIMAEIQKRSDMNKAISIVLEYAVGKLSTTFGKMIALYEPAMLIVGTKGRSLGGFAGLVNQRNSFSKWCLQYSPIPVVVVRPTEKRLKKKEKRGADSTRQEYARILKESGIDEHETAVSSRSNSVFETTNEPDVEAHEVAAALGLPAHFDPTLKPYVPESERSSRKLSKVDSAKSEATTGSLSPESRPSSPGMVMKSPKIHVDNAAASADESSEGEDDDDEGEFEAVPGHMLLGNEDETTEMERKKKLHEMEVGEAAALARGRKVSTGSADSSGSTPGGVPLDDDADGDADDDLA
ncbi:uncharacterized protein PAC_09137 [Phialocephala subalpina]|uniref:UspA domain-containing protein n=1 Tax=Phialocephala subalpina TaxID=576137 RepID=A0A1L7X2K0_9HELO|nr:uncharacterized protein PAC_09137 [Phialocephala subalpina]